MRARTDWRHEQRRYIVFFSDGGTGPRHFHHHLDVGDEPRDGGQRYEGRTRRAAVGPRLTRAGVGAV
jgi:hypothetical protein